MTKNDRTKTGPVTMSNGTLKNSQWAQEIPNTVPPAKLLSSNFQSNHRFRAKRRRTKLTYAIAFCLLISNVEHIYQKCAAAT